MTNLRIGHGYDVHRLAAGRKLILGSWARIALPVPLHRSTAKIWHASAAWISLPALPDG